MCLLDCCSKISKSVTNNSHGFIVSMIVVKEIDVKMRAFVIDIISLNCVVCVSLVKHTIEVFIWTLKIELTRNC